MTRDDIVLISRAFAPVVVDLLKPLVARINELTVENAGIRKRVTELEDVLTDPVRK